MPSLEGFFRTTRATGCCPLGCTAASRTNCPYGSARAGLRRHLQRPKPLVSHLVGGIGTSPLGGGMRVASKLPYQRFNTTTSGGGVGGGAMKRCVGECIRLTPTLSLCLQLFFGEQHPLRTCGAHPSPPSCKRSHPLCTLCGAHPPLPAAATPLERSSITSAERLASKNLFRQPASMHSYLCSDSVQSKTHSLRLL